MSFFDYVWNSLYPEFRVSGYTHKDGTIEFFGRISSVVHTDMVVLDFGAGRGAWIEDECAYRLSQRSIHKVVHAYHGCDVDPVVKKNPVLASAQVIQPNGRIEFPDSTFDAIICDYVMEHIQDPEQTFSELSRVLKAGGYLFIRTPNKWCLTAIFTRLVPNQLHTKALHFFQKTRKPSDVFPTTFSANTTKKLQKLCRENDLTPTIYKYQAEPAYHANSGIILSIFALIDAIKPPQLKDTILLFARKNTRITH